MLLQKTVKILERVRKLLMAYEPSIRGMQFYIKLTATFMVGFGAICAGIWQIAWPYIIKPELTAFVDDVVDAKMIIIQDPQIGLPPIRFNTLASGMSDAPVGGRALIHWSILKTRDCGAPIIKLTVINGKGISHQIDPKGVSILDDHGRGEDLPVDKTMPSPIQYWVKLPGDLLPGKANIHAVVNFPQCPDAPTVRSPVLPFTVLPRGGVGADRAPSIDDHQN